MGLLNLVEEDNRVGFSPDGLGELAALVVAHIPWGRSDESTDAVALLVLAHVDTHHHVFVVEQHLGQSLGQFGFTDAGGAKEDERADGALAVAQARTRAADGVGDDADGFVLTHHALVQLVLEVEEAFALGLEHAGHGNAGPLADHLGYLLGVDFLVDHGVVGLHLFELQFQVLHLLLGLLDAAVAQFGHLAVVALPLGLFGLEFVGFDVFDFGLDGFDDLLLVLPAGLHLVALLAQGAQFLVDLGYLVLVVFALDGFALNFQLAYTAFDFVEFLGDGVNLEPQLGGGLVDEVDSLVGQETVADVAVREFGGGDDGLIFDTHAVVHLVALLQATKDGDGVGHRRFVDEHALESALEGLVLLEIFLVFGEGGGTDGAQLATSQGGLEDVGGVHGALAAAGANEGVNLIDEEDDFAVGLVDFADDALQSLFELAFVLGAGNQGAHVEAVDGLAPQVFGDIPADDTLCQSFGNGGLTDTGFADEDGVVLGAAAEDLQHAADLLVAPDDGVELAGLGQLVEVLGVLVQGVHRLFLVLAGHLGALTQVGDGGLQAFLADAGILEELADAVAAADERQQEVLNADEFVVHLGGALLGTDEGLVGVVAEVDLAAADVR